MGYNPWGHKELDTTGHTHMYVYVFTLHVCTYTSTCNDIQLTLEQDGLGAPTISKAKKLHITHSLPSLHRVPQPQTQTTMYPVGLQYFLLKKEKRKTHVSGKVTKTIIIIAVTY